MTEAEITTLMWPVYLLSAGVVWWLASSLLLRGSSRVMRLLRLLLGVMLFTPTLTMSSGQLTLLPTAIAVIFDLMAHQGSLKSLLPWCFAAGLVLSIDALVHSESPKNDT